MPPVSRLPFPAVDDRRISPLVSLAAIAIVMLVMPAPASAQEPLTSFEQLSSRVTIGDTLWVTDKDGRVTRGRLDQLTTGSLTLQTGRPKLFEAASINVIRQRQHDSVKTGALIGLGVGGAMGTAWCIGAVLDDSGDVDPKVECPEGLIFAGLGTLTGAGIDAIIPGRLTVIYRGQAPPASTRRLSALFFPMISTHRVMLMGVIRR